jgi:hypothetical protein
MSKHTPGPWRIGNDAEFSRLKLGEDSNGFAIAHKTHATAVHGANGDLVADVSQYHHGDNDYLMSVANLYLIAAAPDLLAALQAMLAGPPDDPIGLNDAYATMSDGERVIIDQARAAIAKAEGR